MNPDGLKYGVIFGAIAALVLVAIAAIQSGILAQIRDEIRKLTKGK